LIADKPADSGATGNH